MIVEGLLAFTIFKCIKFVYYRTKMNIKITSHNFNCPKIITHYWSSYKEENKRELTRAQP